MNSAVSIVDSLYIRMDFFREPANLYDDVIDGTTQR